MAITQNIPLGGVALPADQAAIALAISVLLDRIKHLPREDRQDLFELVKAIPQIESDEDLQAFIRAVMEILDQEKTGKQRFSPEEKPAQTPEHYRKWLEYIGWKLREQRTRAGLTQQELAQKTGLPQSHISRLEQGQHSPSHTTREKLAMALNLRADFFEL